METLDWIVDVLTAIGVILGVIIVAGFIMARAGGDRGGSDYNR